MKSSIKKALSTLLSGAILFSGILSYSVCAEGIITRTHTKVGSKVKVTYTFYVDGNKSDHNDNTKNGDNYGQVTDEGFTIAGRKVVTFKFGGTNYAGTKFEIYKQASEGGVIKKGNPVATIDIPIASTGMPTLSKDITLPTGKYAVKAVSASKTASSKGSVTICYADGIN